MSPQATASGNGSRSEMNDDKMRVKLRLGLGCWVSLFFLRVFVFLVCLDSGCSDLLLDRLSGAASTLCARLC